MALPRFLGNLIPKRANGSGSAGVSNNAAREDHTHPASDAEAFNAQVIADTAAALARSIEALDVASRALSRLNHVGLQPASTISDFTEAAQDAVAALLANSTGVTWTYDDANNRLTLAVAGTGGSGGTFDAEAAQDAVAGALVGLGRLSVSYNDAGNQILLAFDATGLASQASLDALSAALASKAPASHSHAIAEVSGLQDALDRKQATSTKGAANGYAGLDAAKQVPRANVSRIKSPPVNLDAGRAIDWPTEAGSVFFATWDGATQTLSFTGLEEGEGGIVIPQGNGRVRFADPGGAGLAVPLACYSEGQGRPVQFYRGLGGKLSLFGAVTLEAGIPLPLPELVAVPSTVEIPTNVGVGSLLFVLNPVDGGIIPPGSTVVPSPNDGRVSARIDYNNNRILIERGVSAVSAGGPVALGAILAHPQNPATKTATAQVTFSAPLARSLWVKDAEISRNAYVVDFAAPRTYRGADAVVGGSLTGLVTATRAGLAYAEDASGALVQFAANTPRVTSRGLLVENAAATQMAQSPMNPNLWTDPDGVTLTDLGTTGFEPFHPVRVTTPAPDNYRGVFFLPETALTGPVAFRVRVRFGSSGLARVTARNSAYQVSFIEVDQNGLTADVPTGAVGTITNVRVTAKAGGTYDVFGVFTPASNGNYTLRAGPASRAAGQFIDLFGAQVEAGTTQSSWIATAGATRAAETVSLAGEAASLAASSAAIYPREASVTVTPGTGAITSPTPVYLGRVAIFPTNMNAGELDVYRNRIPYLGGINLTSLALSPDVLPGVAGTNYFDNPAEAYPYFAAKGFKQGRINIVGERIWSGTGALETAYAALVDTAYQRVLDNGGVPEIDLHNYMRWTSGGTRGIIGAGATFSPAKLAELWVILAKRYPLAILGLMNEPNSMSNAVMVSNYNIVLSALRNAGCRNVVMVNGNQYSGAYSWVSSGTAAAMLRIEDPLDNIVFQPHSYLDDGYDGNEDTCVIGSGVSRLQPATDWARANGKKLFLGEIGWGANSQCHTEGAAALKHVRDNADVWRGFSYWGAGRGLVQYSIQPDDLNNPVDKPQMASIVPYLSLAPNNAAPAVTRAAPAPTGTAQAGKTLTAPGAEFSGFPVPNKTRQWLLNGNVISGAINATYDALSADTGETVSYRDTATNNYDNVDHVATSTSPGVVIAAAAGAPVYSGSGLAAPNGYAATGRPLTVPSNGSWNNSPTSYTYAWYRYDANGVRVSKVSGATGGSFTSGSGEKDFRLGYSIIANNASGRSVEIFSALSVVIVGAVTTGSLTPNPPSGVVMNVAFTVNWTIADGQGGELTFFRNGGDTDNVTIPAGATSGSIQFVISSSGTIGRLRLYGANRAQLFSGNTFTPAAS